MKIKAFIMDIDGTLLSSRDAHLHAWKRAIREYGIIKSEAEIVAHFGKPTPIISAALAETNDHQVAEDIAVQKTEYFIAEIAHIRLYKDVKTILNTIHAAGIPIVFASSNYNRVIEEMYRTFEWDKISVGYVGIDDIKHSKPDPEMIVKALKKANVAAADAVMIGDSVYDIQAGKAAGTKTIAVCTKHGEVDFQQLQPDLILNAFWDLLPLLPLDL